MSKTKKIVLRCLDADDKCYDDSMKEVEKIEDLFKKLREDEENVRLLVDKPKEITQSRDEIKKIIMEQTQMEGQLDRKMA